MMGTAVLVDINGSGNNDLGSASDFDDSLNIASLHGDIHDAVTIAVDEITIAVSLLHFCSVLVISRIIDFSVNDPNQPKN